MKKKRLVSVVIPTFNRADLICRAIDSALNQTYSNVELIVVDDGSTDDTLTVIAHYGDRISVISQENAGPAIARNRGIALAKGEFVALLDSDDYWLPEKLAYQIEVMERAGPDVPCCLCNATVQYPDGSTTSTFEIADMVTPFASALWLNPAQVLSSRFVIFNQAVVIRKSALDKVGGFDETLKFYEDYEFPLRLALLGPWTIIRDELVVYCDGSPGSWAQKALRECVRLHEDLVSTRERILAQMERDERHVESIPVLVRELRRSQRELVASRLIRSDFPFSRALGHALRKVEKIRRSAYIRSSHYPKMQVQEISYL